MFGPGFGLFCVAVIIGWWIAEGGRNMGQKISRLTAEHSGCSVSLSDDCEYYRLCYLGPNHHIEHGYVYHIHENSFWNDVKTLEYDGKTFEAQILRRDYKDVIYRKESVSADSLKKLSEAIEKKFKIWNYEETLRINEEWAKKHSK